MAGRALAGRGLGLLGAGRMAEALVRGVIRARLLPAEAVVASDPDAARREAFAALGVRAVADNAIVAREADVLVLAVKPQVLNGVLDGLASEVRPRHLVVSIAAGVTMARIESKLPPGTRVIRVMPNTPMQVGMGAAAVARGSSARADDVETAMALFGASGLAVEVDEGLMDAVTAVSGSGPAYVFMLAECMVEAGAAEGLPRRVARALAAATIRGAGELLAAGAEEPTELRGRVTSPGGTTEAAFSRLDDGRVREQFVAAIRRAAERSRELSSS